MFVLEAFDLSTLTQVKSFLTAKIIGSENPAHSTGQSVFRFLIPTEKLMQDPEARKVIEGRPDGIYVGSASDRRLVWYPCRGLAASSNEYIITW